MELEPWAPPCLLGDGNPAAQRGGGHAVPTCLGSHRGAEECLETGGAELADCPHAAGVPRRMPPAPGGQGRDWQRSGRSRQRPGRCTWLSSGLPSTKQVPSTWGSSPVLCGRVQAGEPEHSRFWLELALVGELQPQEPTRQPQPIPAAPAHQSVPLPEPHRAAQSHSEDKEFGNSPAASLPRPPALGSPLAPAGGRQRGIFRVVLSLRIRALSIRSWRSRSNERCMREGAPREVRRCERGGATTAPAPGVQGPGPNPDPA